MASTHPLGSSIRSLLEEYQTIANNLANVGTAGFKRQINTFSRHLIEKLSDGPEDDPPLGELLVQGVTDFSQGTLIATERPLDVALQGKGFFVIETPDGPLYTRNGSFHVDAQGRLVDVNDRQIAGADGLIMIPPGVNLQELEISSEGAISANGAQFGRLRIVDFGDDESRLRPVGFGAYQAPDGLVPAPAQDAQVRQGYQEGSNVKLMEELVGLISAARMYEMNMNLMNRNRDLTRTILGVANG